MDWQRKPGWAERIIDAGIPPLVGAGAAAPTYVFAPVAPAVLLAAAVFVSAALLSVLGLKYVARPKARLHALAPETLALPDFDATVPPETELLLDDPLDGVDRDSRVVRLFAPETMSIPGELAERIDRWLEAAQEREPVRLAAGGGGHGPTASPASAALHAALNDIRRTLR